MASFAGSVPPLTENGGRTIPGSRHTVPEDGRNMMIPLILRVMLTALGFDWSVTDLLVEVLSVLFRIIG
jgi:hypothetical protein